MRYILFLLLCLIPTEAFANLNHILASTCRIYTVKHNGKAFSGTGFIYAINGDVCQIMTAAHIFVEISADPKPPQSVKVQFCHSGKFSHFVNANVLFYSFNTDYDEDKDVGFLSINLKDLKTYPRPKVLQLAHKGYNIHKDSMIESYGNPNGRWPTGWVGSIMGTDKDKNKFVFIPRPLGGRSGSPIVQNNKVIGMVVSQNIKYPIGHALTIKSIMRALDEWDNHREQELFEKTVKAN